jgi:hypothetical protein
MEDIMRDGINATNTTNYMPEGVMVAGETLLALGSSLSIIGEYAPLLPPAGIVPAPTVPMLPLYPTRARCPLTPWRAAFCGAAWD